MFFSSFFHFRFDDAKFFARVRRVPVQYFAPRIFVPHALLRKRLSRFEVELSSGEVSKKHRQRISDVPGVFVRMTRDVMVDGEA